MNRYYQLILAVVLAGLISPVEAETFSYTFVSLEYEKFSSKIDGFPDAVEGSGVSIDLSFAVRPNAAIIFEYSTGNAEVTSSGTTVDADIKSGLLGFLIHVPVNDTADFLVGVGFINGKADVDVNNAFYGSVDVDGGMAYIGTRLMVSDKLELNGFIRRNAIEDTSNISLNLGIAYYIDKSVSIDLGSSFDTDSDSDYSLAFGATKYF